MDFLKSVAGNASKDSVGRDEPSGNNNGGGYGGILSDLRGGRDHDERRESDRANTSSSSGIAGGLNGFLGGNSDERRVSERENTSGGGIGDKLNSFLGGGPESEKKEDWLDKTIDFVQEHVFKQGPQDNESAFEQAKDERISDYIRDQYKSNTGKEFPVADK